MLREWLKSNPIGIEDGLRHDKWLCMMWPRLRLLQELLNEDGLLFISIDDNEFSRLRCLIEDVLGMPFLGQFIWKSRQNKDNRNTSGLSVDHEYILIIGKNISGEARNGELFGNHDGDPRGLWASGNMVGLASNEERPNLHFDLIDPHTEINYGCPLRGWRYEKATMQKLIADNRILWPVSPEGRPRERLFLSEMSERTNVSSVIDLPVYTRNGTDWFERIMGNRDFSFPKPPELIEFLILQHINKNALILDSFAGSGTTAQAVLTANAKDGGDRKFILVECEDYADTLTAERIRRVINGYAFSGTQREELHRENLTFTSLKKADKLLGHVESIKAEVKDGALIVTGEKAITERVAGLGGSFTFCTLGDAIDMDQMLTGESLPAFEQLGTLLFHTATNEVALNPLPTEFVAGCGYLGESTQFHVWLIYRPDLEFLKSREAALTLSRAEALVAAKPGKRHCVFAPAKFVSQKLLNAAGLPVEFAPLPFALYRIERG